MSKPAAHLVLLVFDALAILALYYVIDVWREIHHLIDGGVKSIGYQNRFSFLLLLGFVPVVHLFSFIAWRQQFQSLGNGLLLGLFAVLLMAAFYLNGQIKNDLMANGYEDCVNLGIVMTFSEFKTYMKFDSACIESKHD